MATFGAEIANCHVYTFKEGLLSVVAHDLKLRIEKFSLDINVEDGAVTATFDPSSLRVVCAMKDGSEVQGALTPKDCRYIEASIVKDVIDIRKYPQIVFTSTKVDASQGVRVVEGILTLNGQDRPIKSQVLKREGLLITECTLHQPDFGIKPFSAMLGTLKIKPDIKVVVSMPAKILGAPSGLRPPRVFP